MRYWIAMIIGAVIVVNLNNYDPYGHAVVGAIAGAMVMLCIDGFRGGGGGSGDNDWLADDWGAGGME